MRGIVPLALAAFAALASFMSLSRAEAQEAEFAYVLGEMETEEALPLVAAWVGDNRSVCVLSERMNAFAAFSLAPSGRAGSTDYAQRETAPQLRDEWTLWETDIGKWEEGNIKSYLPLSRLVREISVDEWDAEYRAALAVQEILHKLISREWTENSQVQQFKARLLPFDVSECLDYILAHRDRTLPRGDRHREDPSPLH